VAHAQDLTGLSDDCDTVDIRVGDFIVVPHDSQLRSLVLIRLTCKYFHLYCAPPPSGPEVSGGSMRMWQGQSMDAGKGDFEEGEHQVSIRRRIVKGSPERESGGRLGKK
jgi:hypothetical protein